MTELETLRSKLFTANAMQFAIRAERDALKKDLAEAQETISAVRKRAERAESHSKRAEEVAHQWKEGREQWTAKAVELDRERINRYLEWRNTKSALTSVKGLLQASESRVAELEKPNEELQRHPECGACGMVGTREANRSHQRGCAHPGCLEEPIAEVISFYCGKHNPFPPHPDHPFGPEQVGGNVWQIQDARNLDAVGPAREAPSAGEEGDRG